AGRGSSAASCPLPPPKWCAARRAPEPSEYAQMSEPRRLRSRWEVSMPGLKGRLSTVVKSKISKQLDRSENPSETLDYAYERQVENLQNVKKGIADIATAKKRLALQQQQLGEQGAKLDAQAREAMSAGREDLARAALERKQLTVQEADSLDQQIAQLES